jgi:hypothetical protein
MGQSELLEFVCRLLEKLGVRHMVTGSQATIAYGEPRFTNDIDIVAALDSSVIEEFCDGFPEDDYYLSRPAAREAVARHGMFNVIHPTSGLKVDVVIASPVGYDQTRLDRAQRVRVAGGYEARFTTPEDIIVKKLEWNQMGGGERHLQDIAGILKVRGKQLDIAYIERTTTSIGVREMWDAIRNRWLPC